MIIIYGSRLYGKVDVVPGLFHVETKFGHLYYIPLIPVESYAILSKNGDNWNGVKIPMSFKSVLYGWLRALTLVAGIVGTILAIIEFNKPDTNWITPAIVGVFAIFSFIVLTFHKGSTRASYSRAHQIGEIIGLNDHGKMMIDQIYGYQEGVKDPFASEV